MLPSIHVRAAEAFLEGEGRPGPTCKWCGQVHHDDHDSDVHAIPGAFSALNHSYGDESESSQNSR